MSYQVVLYLLGTLGLYSLYRIANFVYYEWTSPLHVLPGPPNPSLIYGNIKLIDKGVCDNVS